MNRSMTRRGTTNSTGNLGSVVLILIKNGLTYTSLSTQSLSSLDPSSDYLAIIVKIKRASPIHLFNVYVPPIRSSFDSRPKSFLPFFLPSSSTTYIFGDFNGHHSSWDSHSPEDQSGKDLFDWLLSSDLLPINNPEHYTLLHRATGNRSYPDLSLIHAQIASKCTWQTLPDLGSDHLPISITISTSPIINSFHRPPNLTIIKLAGTTTLLILIPTALLPLTLQHFLFLKPPTPLPNSSMMLPLLPFLSAASTALLKPGGLLKSQMPSRNAERHLQRHTVSKKTSRTISLLMRRYTSTVISKAKAKSWQKTCSSLFPKTRPSEVFSLLRSISGSPSPTPSDLSNFPNCHTPVDCANHISSHLQSHFFTQTPNVFEAPRKLG